MAASYKRLLQLLEKWPVDKNKQGRNLAEYLREEIQTAFNGKTFETNPEQWDRNYLALKKISDDQHLKQSPRRLVSSATGLTAEQCNQILQPEFLQEAEKENKGFFQSLMFWRN